MFGKFDAFCKRLNKITQLFDDIDRFSTFFEGRVECKYKNNFSSRNYRKHRIYSKINKVISKPKLLTILILYLIKNILHGVIKT